MIDSEQTGKYAHVWSKYKPVMVKMMVDAPEGEQSYQLSNHEFIDVNPKRVTGYSFDVEVSKGRVLVEPKNNLLIADLMYILRRSERAIGLMETNKFRFALSKEFKLTISLLEESNS